jgi:hypothetical protein
MSFGFFEHISAFDEQAQTNTRKALAVAVRRVEDRFSKFLRTAQSNDEYLKRLSLIQEDIDDAITDAAEEYGADPEKVVAAVNKVIAAGGYCDDCKSWKSGPNGGGCSCSGFSGDDDEESDDDDEEKKESKTADHLQPVEALDPGEPKGVANLEAELADAPSAVGTGTIASTPLPVMEGLPQGAQGAPLAPPVAPAPGGATAGPACPDCQSPMENGTCMGCGYDIRNQFSQSPYQALPDRIQNGPMASARQAADVDTGDTAEKRKKLPTGDESALDGPSPKTDHRTWKPNALGTPNLHPIDVDGGRYKKTEQDVTDKPDWESDGWKADSPVVEHESLPSNDGDAGYDDGGVNKGPHTDTWSGMDGLADPVTKAGAIDPEKNPIRDILSQGFIPSDEVTTAIDQYDEDHDA